jgi:hypothetical protein
MEAEILLAKFNFVHPPPPTSTKSYQVLCQVSMEMKLVNKHTLLPIKCLFHAFCLCANNKYIQTQ